MTDYNVEIKAEIVSGTILIPLHLMRTLLFSSSCFAMLILRAGALCLIIFFLMDVGHKIVEGVSFCFFVDGKYD